METLHCDILIIGASTGGVAAALAASEAGASTVLVEASNRLGGQLTAQGVSLPDEHQHIEYFGATRRYMEFRRRIRDYYREQYQLTDEAAANPVLNVGNCWVSKLSFEPWIGDRVLARMLYPGTKNTDHFFIENPNFRMYIFHDVTHYELNEEADTILAVTVKDTLNKTLPDLLIVPKFVLDATDLGDVLAAVGIEGEDWITGAESFAMTGEPDAPAEPKPHWVQPFTFPFALEWSSETAETNTITPPHDYAELKQLQNYHIKHGAITGLFNGKYPWWIYRRILSKENFLFSHPVPLSKRPHLYRRIRAIDNLQDERVPTDVAMINTAGNDYYGGNIIGEGAGNTAQIKHTLNKAVRVSRGYCYWLQTECPREESDFTPLHNPLTDEPFGYPEMRLVKEIFNTKHGCSPAPYIRESRRIIPKRRILEQEIVVKDFQGNVCRGDNARAAFMPDSVGIGHYALDIHPNGHGEPNYYVPTRPFQIPLGALIPVRLKNLLPACKNLGTTHLTNGAYRLHPIEWNIGESSALLAHFCIRNNIRPVDLFDAEGRRENVNSKFNAHDERRQIYLDEFFEMLIEAGISRHWYVDVPLDHPAFKAVQCLADFGFPLGHDTDLLFRPDDPIDSDTWGVWRSLMHDEAPETFNGTRAEALLALTK